MLLVQGWDTDKVWLIALFPSISAHIIKGTLFYSSLEKQKDLTAYKDKDIELERAISHSMPPRPILFILIKYL